MPDLEAFSALLARKSKGAARLKPLLLDQVTCVALLGCMLRDHAQGLGVASRLLPRVTTAANSPIDLPEAAEQAFV